MKKIFLILIIAILLGLFGIKWDQGYHLHPDERMLIMVADRINFFNNLNPDFFNYGSLPIYMLKGVSQLIDSVLLTHLADYASMLYVGRVLSVTAYVLTIFFIYKISLLLFKKEQIALLSSFFYTISFFPIQNSHFFVVDVFLTLLTTLLIYLLLNFISSRTRHDRDKVVSLKQVAIIGITYAAMMSTKFTALIFLPIILLVIIIKSFLTKHSPIQKLIISLFIFNFSFLTFHFLFMPYAFLNFNKYIADVMAQVRMNSNPYVFPYTLQYVYTTPYFYYLKNIFLWGLGPIISILSIVGIISSVLSLRSRRNKFLIYFIFYLLYFLIIGRSSVKFMRYMLPIYPFLAIMAGYGMYTIRLSVFGYLKYPIILGAIVWSFMFINIYSQTHTRIEATDWILKNIPKGSNLAIEHWDDLLPLKGGENYKFTEMTLYNQPDNNQKWEILNNKLTQADYIIIASNRLYVPLQKLSNCQKYMVCYPKTTEYYQNLFGGKLGFKKIAEFNAYPQLGLGKWKISLDDQSADESFTVYDHPKILIFKKI